MPRAPALGFIFITLTLDVLGFGLLIPVAPRLVESMLHNGAGGTEAEAAPIVAALQSTFYVMAFLFAPVLGVLSDRIGRRPVILFSLFGSGVDYLAMALAPTIPWLFVTRILNGLTGASFSAASAYVADVTSPEKRAAGFGMIGAAFGLGFVIGPIIGGVLGDIDIRLPFYVASAMTFINWMYGLFVLPESLAPHNRTPFQWRRANPIGALFVLKKHSLVMGMAIALFLLNIAQFALHATWALSMQYRFAWTPMQIGLSLTIVGLGGALVQGGLARKIIPMLGERRSLMFGLAIGVLAYIGYGAVPKGQENGWMIYVIVAIASLAGIAQPAGQALVTTQVLPSEQGTLQGALASMASLAGIIGPIVGGTSLAFFIATPPPIPNTPVHLTGGNFYISAILAIFGMIAAGWAIRQRGHVDAPSIPPEARTLGKAH